MSKAKFYRFLGRAWEFFEGSTKRVRSHPKKNPLHAMFRKLAEKQETLLADAH